jgi:hypothetical protein
MVNKECLNCRWLKLDDIYSGICRKLQGKDAPRPMVKTTYSCGDWQNAGQQYHIRMGWIKNQKSIKS